MRTYIQYHFSHIFIQYAYTPKYIYIDVHIHIYTYSLLAPTYIRINAPKYMHLSKKKILQELQKGSLLFIFWAFNLVKGHEKMVEILRGMVIRCYSVYWRPLFRLKLKLLFFLIVGDFLGAVNSSNDLWCPHLFLSRSTRRSNASRKVKAVCPNSILIVPLYVHAWHQPLFIATQILACAKY